jgi:hypothetical protein
MMKGHVGAHGPGCPATAARGHTTAARNRANETGRAPRSYGAGAGAVRGAAVVAMLALLAVGEARGQPQPPPKQPVRSVQPPSLPRGWCALGCPEWPHLLAGGAVEATKGVLLVSGIQDSLPRGGVFLRYDGKHWTTLAKTSTPLRGLWAASPSSVFVGDTHAEAPADARPERGRVSKSTPHLASGSGDLTAAPCATGIPPLLLLVSSRPDAAVISGRQGGCVPASSVSCSGLPRDAAHAARDRGGLRGIPECADRRP